MTKLPPILTGLRKKYLEDWSCAYCRNPIRRIEDEEGKYTYHCTKCKSIFRYNQDWQVVNYDYKFKQFKSKLNNKIFPPTEITTGRPNED